MKIYLIQEVNVEYNDEYYYAAGYKEMPRGAFKSLENAKAELVKLNAKVREDDLRNEDNDLIERFVIKELEVSNSEVVSKKELRGHFDQGVAELFKKHKELGGFVWTQYAPAFNVHDHGSFAVSECDEEKSVDECDYHACWDGDIAAFLGSFTNEEMEIMFDFAEVRVTRDGVKEREVNY